MTNKREEAIREYDNQHRDAAVSGYVREKLLIGFEDGWDARVRITTEDMKAHDEAVIAEHTQTVINVVAEATTEALVEAELRGYERRLSETLLNVLKAQTIQCVWCQSVSHTKEGHDDAVHERRRLLR